ncbi:FAD-dependent oxidoreductase [Aetokthonos hydrillicola Thurmond2011]|jgi:thioredoxin reductase (NADPH)|uniref:FAD-dependent oxidoreductase n=1 Tax=Aetokthonos hydrillicola Thurmond2011 TaxID=2712845 RepID=A0AAP5IGS6_9CYAN|nr:response regulator [Aetokthonos hydrillicola]MBO3459680.1 FAD-dependent oxidoreductase [Aetokthonos hydrillicola CCALA 1050]MBW4589044.1 FAD-dependent oxidoreductase [Aetokthonos hydrillicola CCALA 1050]MDR9900117.1 FAD-dependent oxidoreductase [Aetokthonos hydrillicola Thurmond2011]
MAKPVILAIDDDPEVLQAVTRDLRQEYGDRFRILRADSGHSALEALAQLKLRNQSVALFLADQRMPHMSGVEFLEQALQMFPDAKRALLTAYADTDAAIRAINNTKIDYYLMKPWDPPQERLYPVLNDLLDDWLVAFQPPFEGIRLIGNRWSPHSHQAKDFLARNQVPYQWMDIELSKEAQQLTAFANCDQLHLPLVLFADGSNFMQPSNTQIAEKIGLRTRAEKEFYDLIIVGGGPAGLAAAVYGASEGLRTVMIEREAPGGQAGTSSRIENYLGFPQGLSGGQLAQRAVAQAKRFGVEILTPQECEGIRVENQYRFVQLADGSEISCHAMILALGVSWRRLDIPGLDRLTGAGVYYGAAQTEAMSCQGEEVYIVGGANSAGQAAMYFSKYAHKVRMLVRGESLTKSMSQYLIDQIADTENITVETHTSVVEVKGETRLEAITLENNLTGEKQTVPATSLFIFIGAVPRTDWLDGVVKRDERGFILTGPYLPREDGRIKGWTLPREPYLLETNIPGVFAVGDVRHGSVKRVASGVGEGSISVQFVHQYLSNVV